MPTHIELKSNQTAVVSLSKSLYFVLLSHQCISLAVFSSLTDILFIIRRIIGHGPSKDF